MVQPWLKSKKEGGAASEGVERLKTEESDLSMLEAVAHDIIQAVAAKDTRLLVQALESLVDHIQYEDQIQDQQEG